MAHNIQKRDIQTGISMAWHKLTNVVEKIDETTASILYPMYISDTFYRDADGNEQVANARQIVSSDDNLPIGRGVGVDYKLISNREIWESVVQGLEGTKHEVVSVGTVNDRSLGFISVKIAEDFKAANRETAATLNIMWGHGGNKAVLARTGFTVVVCQNTLDIAMAEKSDLKLSIRHTAKANVLDLGKAIDSHIGVAAEFKKAMDGLHVIEAKADTARKIYAGFLSEGETPETKTGISRLTNTVDELERLFNSGKGNSGRTMADVFNGLTDLYSHGNGQNPWKQYVSSEFGAGSKTKSEFFDVLNCASRRDDAKRNGEKVLLELGL